MISKKSFEDAKQKVLYLARAALDKKGFNLAILEIGKVNPFTDYFLIVNGRSDRHVQAIADEIGIALKKTRGGILGMEGYGEGKWVLIDGGDVVVHIFQETTRAYYDLEGLWIDAPRIQIEESGADKKEEKGVAG